MKNKSVLTLILFFICQHSLMGFDHCDILKDLEPAHASAFNFYVMIQETKKTNNPPEADMIRSFISLRDDLKYDEPTYFPAFDDALIRLFHMPCERKNYLTSLVYWTTYNADTAFERGQNPEVYFKTMDYLIDNLPIEEQLFASICMDQANS